MAAQLNPQEQVLRDCYLDATVRGGLIDFTQEIRTDQNNMQGKYSVKPSRLASLFSGSVWKDAHKKSGHRKLQNIVTSVVVEYGDHDNKGNIDPGAAVTIYEAVQKHLNILNNTIFAYTENNWKVEPDYVASLRWWEQYARDAK